MTNPSESSSATGALRVAAVREQGLAPVRLCERLLQEMFAHAVECYPEECCGLLFGFRGKSPDQIVRCTNVQSHRKSRGESELDAREGFWIDEKELMLALREAERQGQELWGVYHSHIDSDAYLSKTDLAGAVDADGAPRYPGAAQVVLSAWEDGVRDVACFAWNTDQLRYRGHPVERATS